MNAQKMLVTAEELLRPPYSMMRCELVEGEVIEMPPSGEFHGALSARFAKVLGNFVDAQKRGRVYGAETGFYLRRRPDTVRAPDAAFIAASRLPPGKPVSIPRPLPDGR